MHYENELASDPVRRELISQICRYLEVGDVTLLYAAKDPVHNNAVILKDWIKKILKEEKETEWRIETLAEVDRK
ncbi:DUF488 domain-containing protein [Thermoactinomyces mirandus]|uniref:DUF488 domain-containing protein n=1 Tax=Thermoactinomyces mirandus TaxID=2756294 RepID=UPI0028ABBC79|nr:DUF488 domain-containing protein [Thermoactinomyces mirandus]